MLLLISKDIHPNPGPIDPCSVCSRRVTWGNRSIQCTGCSLWVHLSCSGLSPADFRKISPGHSWTCPMCPSSSQPLPSLSHSNPVSSSFSVSPSFHTPNTPPPLTNTHKTISLKTKPSPKTTSNNPTYPPNHPQLIYTYPPSHHLLLLLKPIYHLSSHTILFPSFLSLSKQPPNPTVEC